MVPATVMMRVPRRGTGCSREGWNRNRHQNRREHEGTKLLHLVESPGRPKNGPFHYPYLTPKRVKSSTI
jgi:hypothetical protein